MPEYAWLFRRRATLRVHPVANGFGLPYKADSAVIKDQRRIGSLNVGARYARRAYCALVESARGARAQTGAVAPGNETIVGGRAQSYRRHPRAYGLSVNPTMLEAEKPRSGQSRLRHRARPRELPASSRVLSQ